MFRVLCRRREDGNLLVFDDSDNTMEYASDLDVKVLQSKGYSVSMDLHYSDILDVLFGDETWQYVTCIGSETVRDAKFIALSEIVGLLGFTFDSEIAINSALFGNCKCIFFTSGYNFYCIALNSVSKIAELIVLRAFKHKRAGWGTTIYRDFYLIRVKRNYYVSDDVVTFKVISTDNEFCIERLK